MRSTIVFVALLAAAPGCARSEHREAREKYNEGVAALAKSDFDAAEKALTEARSAAGVDPELRFRAAYDLGLAYAAHADKLKSGEEPDLARALDLAETARSWLADAARLRKDDPDTQANLAIVRARVQAISDELHKSEKKLEARLDALIGDQRTLLEDARGAWLATKDAGGADPLAQQGTLTHLADRERGIVAEAGVIGDIAADETNAIEGKPADKRSDEEKVRLIVLGNLTIYLGDARTRIAEARRKLQDLAAEEGVAKSEAALVALKRAREQLLDPITVLRGVMEEEMALLGDTARVAGDKSILGEMPPLEKVPAWLEPPAMGDRQGGLKDRVEEVRARLAAAVEHKDEPKTGDAEDPKRKKLLERVVAALPSVVEASSQMDKARQSLAARETRKAVDPERAAVEALARAIEEFVDLKQLIELAYAGQKEIVALLSPESAKELAAPERAKRTHDGVAHNVTRIGRLRELIADEVAGVDERAKKAESDSAAAAGGGNPDDAKHAAEEAKKAADEAKEQLALAEKLRGEAAAALEKLDKALAANEDPMPPAKEADGKIEELRKLFFSVAEHLKQLIRDQGETKDRTSAANADDEAARAPKLPLLTSREEEHGRMAKAITEALAGEADAAAKKPPQQGAPDAKALSSAAEEVRLASRDIGDAGGVLAKARDAAKPGEKLDPAVKSETQAIEHLEAALKLLEPPKQKNKEEDQQQQQQGGAAQQEPGDRKDDASKAGGQSQRARDEDARRQRERKKDGGGSEPVEKDW